MYEVITIIAGKEVLVEVVDNITTASNMCSFYRCQGQQAYYRPVLRKVA